MKLSTALGRTFAKAAKLLLQVFYLVVYHLAPRRHRTCAARAASPSLLIVKMDAIGDYILFRSYLQCIRASGMFGSITLCGNGSWRELAEYFDASYVDDFIWIERNRFIVNALYTLEQMRGIGGRRFDVALQPTYSRDLADLILIAADAPRKMVFDGDSFNVSRLSRLLSNLFLTDVIESDPGTKPDLTRNAEFFHAALGLPESATRPDFDSAKVDALRVDVPRGAYAVIFPGAGRGHRRWPARHFAAAASELRERHRMEIVVAGGPNDRELGRDVRRGCPEAVDLSGMLSLSQMTRLVRDARLLVSNDTMVVHMAVALRTRFVCISNGNSFGRFLPYPDDVLMGSECVFPEGMMTPGDSFEDLVERYSEWSDLDISTITLERVCAAMDRALRVG